MSPTRLGLPESGGTTGAAGTGGIPACSTTTDNGTKLAAAAFCQNLLATCTGLDGYVIAEAYNTQAKCEAAYAASTKQACQSYHLCGNAFNKTAADKKAHCPHATGSGRLRWFAIALVVAAVAAGVVLLVLYGGDGSAPGY